MTGTVAFLGFIILLLGSIMLLRPIFIVSLFRSYLPSAVLYILAVVIRVILGLALIMTASESRFPVTLQALGWMAIGAAFILTVIGRSRFQRLITWALSFTTLQQRYAGVMAILLGGFLIVAVV